LPNQKIEDQPVSAAFTTRLRQQAKPFQSMDKGKTDLCRQVRLLLPGALPGNFSDTLCEKRIENF
jgi:hypothetical protein